MIVCAVTNPASLDEMAAQAAVILNCVRPVSNQHFFVLEQGICSCLAECGSSCSREAQGQGAEDLIQGLNPIWDVFPSHKEQMDITKVS